MVHLHDGRGIQWRVILGAVVDAQGRFLLQDQPSVLVEVVDAVLAQGCVLNHCLASVHGHRSVYRLMTRCVASANHASCLDPEAHRLVKCYCHHVDCCLLLLLSFLPRPLSCVCPRHHHHHLLANLKTSLHDVENALYCCGAHHLAWTCCCCSWLTYA